MSNAEHVPTNRPAPKAKLEPLGYILGVQFHEPLKLVRQRRMELARNCQLMLIREALISKTSPGPSPSL